MESAPPRIMIGFGVSFIEFTLATLIPIYAGMLSVIVICKVTRLNMRYISAFALGLLFWFFFDTMNDAVQLGVNEGYTLDFRQSCLILLFVTGFLLLTLLDGRTCTSDNLTGNNRSPILLGILAAFGMGIHGFGEGLEFGTLAAGTQAVSVVDAIGGAGGGISYFLHKLLESTIVIVVFLSATGTLNISTQKQVRQMTAIGLIFAIPSMVGEAVAYYVPMNATYFFAMGAGAALSVALYVIKPIFGERPEDIVFSRWIRISFSVLLGFFLLYGAALFHS